MPTAALRPCAGCHRTLVVKGRCHACADVRERTRRPAWITKFYSSKAWQAARNLKRRQDPLCQDCLERGSAFPVQVVDHILPLATHPHLRLTLTNLRSLCHHHHALKTTRRPA